MAVYKAYMKIAKKNLWLIVMYLGIFFCVTIMFQSFAQKDTEQGYTTEGVTVGVVDKDGGVLAQSLIDHLGNTNNIVMMSAGQEELQEELFYRNVDYILRIPEDFVKRCILGDETLKVTTVPGTYAGSYVDQQISNYVNFAGVYAAAGFSEEETAEAMADRKEAQVTLADFSGNAGNLPAYSFYYRYLPYLILSVICFVMGYILLGVRRGSLPNRLRASAVPARRQNLEGLAAAGTISAGLWGISTGAAILLYGREMFADGKAGYYMINSAAMLLVALALAYLIGSLVKDSNVLSGVVNIVGLGMSFICGVFVDMEFLNSGVKKAAQFLPVYWYETVNELLADYGRITGSVRTDVFKGIGIQLVFAAAFVCVTLALSGERRRTLIPDKSEQR